MDSLEISTDCAFAIGTTHRVCEDYAICNDNAVVVADGCSSSPNTDFGARILARSALLLLDCLAFGPDRTDFIKAIVFNAQQVMRNLHFESNALDATLLFASADKSKKLTRAFVYGDGMVVGRQRDGNFVVSRFSYKDEWPFYPSMLVDDDKLERYITAGHGDCFYQFFSKIENKYVEIDAPNSQDLLFWFDDFDLVLLFSDGFGHFYELVETETSKSKQDVPWQDVLDLFLEFKNFKGPFVQRRMDRFLKECKKRNWHNADDISAAAIYVG